MKRKFVETENAVRFATALSALQTRGAAEACLIVIEGKPGNGKTTTLKNWVAETGSIYVRANEGWTSSWMYNDILSQLGAQPRHSREAKFEAIINELGQRLGSASRQKRPFGLVIDEADHISKRRSLIEAIRDVSDLLELPTVLVGMGRIRDDIVRFPQVASRVSGYVKFDPATPQDVRRLFDQLCNVEIDDDVIDFVRLQTEGHNREIMEAMARIERLGERNPPEEGHRLNLRDLSGEVILMDRKRGLPIKAPEVL